MGTAAPTQAYDTLIADCGPLEPSRCHQAFSGTIALADGAYTAAFTPLFDASDRFIGALAVAQPQSVALAPAAQFTVVLLFVGLLVTLVVLAAGVWTYNALSGEVLDALHLRLITWRRSRATWSVRRGRRSRRRTGKSVWRGRSARARAISTRW